MSRLRDWLAPPSPEAGAREKLECRTFVVVWVPIFVIGATAAYANGRWLGAALNFVLIGLGAGLGAWWGLSTFDRRKNHVYLHERD